MKKKQFLQLTLILLTWSSFAQIEKGYWMVGGSGSYRSTKYVNDNPALSSDYTILRLAPNIGYFFADKLAGGLNGTFYYNPYGGSAYNLGYGIGPFVRYYFRPSHKLINIFAQANYLYYVDSNTTSYAGTIKSNSSSYGFKAGPVIYFNDSVALELAFEYLRDNINNTVKATDLGITIGFQIHLKK